MADGDKVKSYVAKVVDLVVDTLEKEKAKKDDGDGVFQNFIVLLSSGLLALILIDGYQAGFGPDEVGSCVICGKQGDLTEEICQRKMRSGRCKSKVRRNENGLKQCYLGHVLLDQKLSTCDNQGSATVASELGG
eukprot:CAMPEP_0204823292 /NCGR_PEP_ID=MMETSP1346-20131115/1352_1 /ASSEMBLY_ACC=CAM_ASM_000771 /TAXON_ID=215587 /ORGANISM="Aplanochytrium stocchinoi, Strain GSBS06" /LENGTH=133 /DNA_ID=CAMNT_0051949867 /DNA_START=277 /DNA_END=679 /DNA_ORIENTATION=+